MVKAGYAFEDYYKCIQRKRVVAFSASAFLQLMAENYRELFLAEKVAYVVDNDKSKAGTSFMIGGSRKVVQTIDYLLNDNMNDIVILIGSDRYAYEIFVQLEQIEKLSNVPCFILPLMISKKRDNDDFEFVNQVATDGEGIPKIIHCFWLGDAPLDDMANKCLVSFKKYCPDYDIRLWTNKSYDVTKNKYMYEAYKSRKWAYACDYARLDKLYSEGGIYFDLDVELVSNIDSVLQNDFFAGFGPLRDIELAAFGSKPGNALIGEMLEAYADREFIVDHELSLMDVQPVFMDRFLEKKGFQINGRYQKVNGCALYPREIFSPRNWFTGEEQVEKKSLGIHHCAGSWASKVDKDTNVKRGELLKRLEAEYD